MLKVFQKMHGTIEHHTKPVDSINGWAVICFAAISTSKQGAVLDRQHLMLTSTTSLLHVFVFCAIITENPASQQ